MRLRRLAIHGLALTAGMLFSCGKPQPPAPVVSTRPAVPQTQAATAPSPTLVANGFFNRALDREKAGDEKGAIDMYTRAVEIDPKHADSYNNRGILRKHQDDLDAAIADFTRAIEIDPKDSMPYFNRGTCWDLKKQYASAAADYGEAFKLSRDAQALSRMAMAKRHLGDKVGALQDCNLAVSLHPSDPGLYNDRAYVKEELHDDEGAIEDYTRALQVDPKNARALEYRGACKKRVGDLKGAIADYGHACALQPDDSLGYFYLGLAHMANAEPHLAVADFTTVIRLNPKDKLAYTARGTAYADLGRFDDAIAEQTRAIAMDPKESNGYHRRAITYLRMREWAAAIKDLEKQIEVEPEDAEYAPLYLWMARMQLNEKDAARQQLGAWTKEHHNLDNPWPGKIAGFLLGTLTEEQLLGAAEAGSATDRKERLCEAYYFFAVKRLQAGDVEIATDYLRKSVATGLANNAEYRFAVVELARLRGGKTDAKP